MMDSVEVQTSLLRHELNMWQPEYNCDIDIGGTSACTYMSCIQYIRGGVEKHFTYFIYEHHMRLRTARRLRKSSSSQSNDSAMETEQVKVKSTNHSDPSITSEKVMTTKTVASNSEATVSGVNTNKITIVAGSKPSPPPKVKTPHPNISYRLQIVHAWGEQPRKNEIIASWRKVSLLLEETDTLILNNIPDNMETTNEIDYAIGALSNNIETVVENSSREVPAADSRQKLPEDVHVLLRAKNAAMRRASAYPTCKPRSCARAL
ncbi:hypothetical protein EVAR_6694_1 [Eumeta japonica]|uniref:Uncharacterized protein n=1 Tax=Eumeta variegata TaxID=151549 RepID=A0A4C1TLW2_EUMVA|nr:hypothetical protein EVAR_6694_1 [Eumeta japonica]